MAMPKKGVRKITVDGKVYKYVIKNDARWFYRKAGGRITIEMANGKYHSTVISDEITPMTIENIIREYNVK